MARLDLVIPQNIKNMLIVISTQEGRSMTKQLEKMIKNEYKRLKAAEK